MVSVVVTSPIRLHSCPFCGSQNLHIETDSHEGSSYQVYCDNPQCEAEGPNGGKSALEAAEKWNKRTG